MGDSGTEFETTATIRVQVDGGPESDAADIDQLTRRLRAELAELDLESVRHATGAELPVGAKAADPVTIGALVVALSASGGVLPGLIGTVRDWLGRQGSGKRVSITIDGDTIELESASAAQSSALVDAYLRRHGGPRVD